MKPATVFASTSQDNMNPEEKMNDALQKVLLCRETNQVRSGLQDLLKLGHETTVPNPAKVLIGLSKAINNEQLLHKFALSQLDLYDNCLQVLALYLDLLLHPLENGKHHFPLTNKTLKQWKKAIRRCRP